MMYHLVSALLTITDWLRLRRDVHVCEYLPDWLEPDDYRCVCGARPNVYATDLTKNGAPGSTPGAPPQTADHLEGQPAMNIISRPAQDLRAGDIIIRDPDPTHGGRSVRWRVHSRPSTRDDVTIVDYWDIDDEPHPGIGHYQSDADVHVEPVGGAA